ncbi:MAG TPA: glycosyltransferase family 2 protein [Bacteroidota bacterium]|jgi:glycosyltransferase involved in cell wall biosynthesis|nr:glycosyltransferase family 2 protein [Bacteroidota bacterium]
MKSPLSVIIITRNEERNIAECLRSVDWAGDIVVVDADSSDKTVELARKSTEKVFVRKWEGYAAAKAFAMSQTSNEWVLWLDADERVTPDLRDEIQSLLAAPEFRAYEVARRAYFLGKWIRHCGWYPGYVIRLFEKKSVRFSDSNVHESIVFQGSVGRLSNDLLHYTDDTLFHYTAKLNRYTSLAAADLKKKGTEFSLLGVVARPPFMFFKMYILKRGFLDGRHGLVLSLLSSGYVFTKYAKLWQGGRANR